MKKFILLLIIVGGAAIGWQFISEDTSTPTRTDNEVNTQQPEQPQQFDKNLHSLSDESSIWLVVNKDRPISEQYTPGNLRDVAVEKFPGKPLSELKLRNVAAGALEQMFKAASEDGIDMIIGSGYRSYDVQEFYYSNYVETYGQEEADKFSARPGTSEHQTGLAVDVSGIDRNCYLEICFENEPAGRWVADNAADFGFIIRYPKGKSAITGYQYEPWHLRFVGVELAQELAETGLTMEEFFDL